MEMNIEPPRQSVAVDAAIVVTTDLRGERSPIHHAIDGMVDTTCKIAVKVSAAEKYLRAGNHNKAGVALREAEMMMQKCMPVLQIAIWECAQNLHGGKVSLNQPEGKASKRRNTKCRVLSIKQTDSIDPHGPQ